jgi:hypothetical protein
MMDAFVVTQDSWHFRFNVFILRKLGCSKWYATDSVKDRKDFCSYWRLTILSVMGTAFVLLIFGLVGAFLSFLGFHFVIAFMSSPESYLIGVAAAFGMGAFFWVTGKFFDFISTRRGAMKSKEPGMIKTKYKSWKEQYCPMVEFK